MELACALPRPEVESLEILDLCCGSGVLGIEAALRLKTVSQIFFLELQKEFLPHINENLNSAELQKLSKIEIASVGNTEFNKGQFDYIFCNPPYFNVGEGRVSPDVRRQKCRTFEVDSLSIVLEKSHLWLKDRGYLCLATRDERTIDIFLDNFEIIKKEKFSETWLVCLSRLNID